MKIFQILLEGFSAKSGSNWVQMRS